MTDYAEGTYPSAPKVYVVAASFDVCTFLDAKFILEEAVGVEDPRIVVGFGIVKNANCK